MSLTFAVDFDGTLVVEGERPLRWRPGAKELLHGLKEAGYGLVLFSRRSTFPEPGPSDERDVAKFWETGKVSLDVSDTWALFEEMRGFLKQEGSWDLFDKVWPMKPRANFFVDDKAEPADILSLAAEFGIPLGRSIRAVSTAVPPVVALPKEIPVNPQDLNEGDRKYAGREHLVLVDRGGYHRWMRPEDMKPGDKQIKEQAQRAEKELKARIAIPKGRKWVEKLDHLPEETWQLHFDGHPDKGGKPSPERIHAVHEKALQEAEGSVSIPPPGEQKMAILMLGAPASGKSSLSDNLANGKFVKVDADRMKDHLPEYVDAIDKDKVRGTSARNAAAMAHEESSYMAKQARDLAIEKGKHLLVDGTGKNADGYIALIKRLKENGYHVTVMAMDIDKGEAALRAKAREEKKGRHVPKPVFDDAHARLPASIAKVMPYADVGQLFNNDGKAPALVSSWKSGVEEVKDEERRKVFGRKL